MVFETWGTVPHTVAEEKLKSKNDQKKLSTFLSFHNNEEISTVHLEYGTGIRPVEPVWSAVLW